MDWLYNEIMAGFQVMLAARLRNAPPAVDGGYTAEVWVRVFGSQNIAWDEQEDAWRIKEAFFAHIGNSEFFATPKEILSAYQKEESRFL